MNRTRRTCVVLLVAGLVPASQAQDSSAAKPGTPPPQASAPKANPARPAAPQPAPEADDELLEFLGSVDSEAGDQDWIDYLSQTDIARGAKGKTR